MLSANLKNTKSETASQLAIAKMLTYFSNVWAGTADPLGPHIILLCVSIVAAFAVGAGILLESPKHSAAIHRIATWLVLGGIAVESLCTVSLFVFDERISQAQQATIIELQTRTAPRRLSADQCKDIVDSLSSFAGRKARVATYVSDGEGSTLGLMIVVCLRAAHIDVESGMSSILPWGGFFAGVAISGSDTELVKAVSAALRDKGDLTVVPRITGLFPGNVARGADTSSAKAALIVVGVKPVEEVKFK